MADYSISLQLETHNHHELNDCFKLRKIRKSTYNKERNPMSLEELVQK